MKTIPASLTVLMLAGCLSHSAGIPSSEAAENAALSSVHEPEQEAEVPSFRDYSASYVIDETSLIITAVAEPIFAYSDPHALKENSDAVFLGTILSKDGASVIDDIGGFLGIPYTLGTIQVRESYTGDMDPVISFRREGALMTLDDYLEGSPEERKNKIMSRFISSEAPVYISAFFRDDINPEAGRTYLFYAQKKGDMYTLIGERFGILEVIGDEENPYVLYPADTQEHMALEAYLDAYVRE